MKLRPQTLGSNVAVDKRKLVLTLILCLHQICLNIQFVPLTLIRRASKSPPPNKTLSPTCSLEASLYFVTKGNTPALFPVP